MTELYKESPVNKVSVNMDTSNKECLTGMDIYRKVKTYCDKIAFNTVSMDEMVVFINDGISDLWNNINNGGWNFALSDKHEILLEEGKCSYQLPSDFNDISYVGTGAGVESETAERTFQIVNFSQWDTVPLSLYAATYRYDTTSDRVFLYIKTPDMEYCREDVCRTTSPLSGRIIVKYYMTAPQIKDLSDPICKIPKRWDVDKIIAQIISESIHAQKGRPYIKPASFQAAINNLTKKDSGIVVNNPNYRKSKTSFRINRN